MGPQDFALSVLLFLGLLTLAMAVMGFLRKRGSVDLALAGSPLIVVAGLAILIEVASLAGLVQRAALAVALTVSAAGSLLLGRRWLGGLVLLRSDAHRAWQGLCGALSTPTWWRLPLLAAVVMAAAVVLLSAFVALLSPPNNPDVLAYHLPRVMWWLQQGEVGNFIASDPRQLAFPPLNSYLLLVVVGVTGADLLVNMLQWVAATWAALGAVLIARRVGLNAVSVLIVGILVVTIPTGIAVSTTAKADWLAAVWPVLVLLLVVSRSRGRITCAPMMILLAVAAALAGATKATSAIGVGLVVVLALWWELHPMSDSPQAARAIGERVRCALGAAGASLVGVCAGFLPQALRTSRLYGNATGPELDILVTEPSLTILWGNTVRTMLNSIGLPSPVSDWVNGYLPTVLPLIGVPVRDDAAIHYDAVLEVLIGRNEDFATNPIHLILGISAAVVALLLPRSPRRLKFVSGLALVSFLVFVGLIQWNPWTARFLLSVMVIAAIPLAWLLGRALARSSRRVRTAGLGAIVVVVAAAAYGLMIAVYQEYRPLVGPGSILDETRTDQYFAVNDRPGTSGTMQELVLTQVEELRSLPEGARIGMIGVGPQEYLFWRFLNPDGRYVFVNLEGPDGLVGVEPEELDGVVCIEDCSLG